MPSEQSNKLPIAGVARIAVPAAAIAMDFLDRNSSKVNS